MKQKILTYQYYDILLSYFVALLLISNIAATKPILIGPFLFDGGAILFPLTYIIGDVITEVYGFKKARRAILVAFSISILAALTFIAVQHLPGAPEYENQAAFEAVLGFVPQIVIASLVAFFSGQLINSYVLSKMKQKWGEKNLWLRLLSSSVAGELIDTILFCTIAFYGIITGWSFVNYVVVGVAYKLTVEVLLLPVTYRVISYIKKRETTQEA